MPWVELSTTRPEQESFRVLLVEYASKRTKQKDNGRKSKPWNIENVSEEAVR